MSRILAIGADSRAAVDELADRALGAGGQERGLRIPAAAVKQKPHRKTTTRRTVRLVACKQARLPNLDGTLGMASTQTEESKR